MLRSLSAVLKQCLVNVPASTRLLSIPVAAAIAASVTLMAQVLGLWEPWELGFYDWLVMSRGDRGPDPRILIVEIDDLDVQTLGRHPIDDATLAELLATLQTYQPRVIGVDLFRSHDLPPGSAALAQQLRQPNVLGVLSLGNAPAEAIPAPPALARDRTTFADVPRDRDHVVRRVWLFSAAQNGDSYPFLGVAIAQQYLSTAGITPRLTPDNLYQLGAATFRPLPPDAGGYRSLPPGAYPILLDYRSPQQPARLVSLRDVEAGRLNPRWVRDKIVLIGYRAARAKDFFATPYTRTIHQDMSGVQLHAQVASQLMERALGDRPGFRFWSAWAETLWISSWAGVGACLGGLARRRSTVSLLALLAITLPVLMAKVLFAQFIWVPVVAPVAAFVIAVLGIVVDRLAQISRQEKLMLRLLGQQASPTVAQALWQARDQLLHEGRLPLQPAIATILFSDLKGFSSVAEQLRPEDLTVWLNEYLWAMVDLVLDHDGIVNNLMGDGIMAVFGLPVQQPSQTSAQQAVHCALAMGNRLTDLNRNWSQRGLPSVSMRIGIHTGSVMAGSVGSPRRMDYGVLGDTTNIASRLESCEKHHQPSTCRILISHATWADLPPGEFAVEAWGPIHLKGRLEPVETFLVLHRFRHCRDLAIAHRLR